jgi:hypothetical protein
MLFNFLYLFLATGLFLSSDNVSGHSYLAPMGTTEGLTPNLQISLKQRRTLRSLFNDGLRLMLRDDKTFLLSTYPGQAIPAASFNDSTHTDTLHEIVIRNLTWKYHGSHTRFLDMQYFDVNLKKGASTKDFFPWRWPFDCRIEIDRVFLYALAEPSVIGLHLAKYQQEILLNSMGRVLDVTRLLTHPNTFALIAGFMPMSLQQYIQTALPWDDPQAYQFIKRFQEFIKDNQELYERFDFYGVPYQSTEYAIQADQLIVLSLAEQLLKEAYKRLSSDEEPTMNRGRIILPTEHVFSYPQFEHAEKILKTFRRMSGGKVVLEKFGIVKQLQERLWLEHQPKVKKNKTRRRSDPNRVQPTAVNRSY